MDTAAKAEASPAGKCQTHNAPVVSCFLWSPPVVCCPQGHCGNRALRDLPGWLSLSLFCVFLLKDNRGHFHPLDKAGDGHWLMVVTVRPLSIWAHEGCLGRNRGRSLFLHWLCPIVGSLRTSILLPSGILHCDWYLFPCGGVGSPAVLGDQGHAGIKQLVRV